MPRKKEIQMAVPPICTKLDENSNLNVSRDNYKIEPENAKIKPETSALATVCKKKSQRRRRRRLLPKRPTGKHQTLEKTISEEDMGRTLDEDLPYVQQLLNESEFKFPSNVDVELVLEGSAAPESPGHSLADVFSQTPNNEMEWLGTPDELDGVICDLLLKMEEEASVDENNSPRSDLAMDEQPMDASFDNVNPKCALKYGSLNPYLSGNAGSHCNSQLEWYADDLSGDETQPEPAEMNIPADLWVDDIAKGLATLQCLLDMGLFDDAKQHLDIISATEISTDLLYEHSSAILEVLAKALETPHEGVVKAAKSTRENWMQVLSENKTEGARIVFVALWLTLP